MDANLFTEGSIYWYENKSNTKKDYDNNELNHDFIVSRPVYILKSNPCPFDNFTVNVLIITSSQKRVGIPININGIKDGKILPYNFRSIHKEYLTRYMGQASPEIMKEVNDAVRYHSGFSDDKPNYLIEYENYEKEINDFISSLTIREKTVYDFVENKCLFKSEYYTTPEEMFKTYSKKEDVNNYSRIQDFSKVMTKIMNVMTSITCEVVNHEKIYYGISVNGNTHKIDIDYEKVEKKRKILNDDIYKSLPDNFESLSNDQLLDLMSEKTRKEYYRLDIVQKIENYKLTPLTLHIDNIDKKDAYILKEIIDNDVNEKKEHVFKLLDKGVNPLNMSTVNQYALFVCSNDEILNHVAEKYLRRGGIHKLRKMIFANIKHFMGKVR